MLHLEEVRNCSVVKDDYSCFGLRRLQCPTGKNPPRRDFKHLARSVLQNLRDIRGRTLCLSKRIIYRRFAAKPKHSEFIDTHALVSKDAVRLCFDRENSARPNENVIDVRLINEQIIKRDITLAPEPSE